MDKRDRSIRLLELYDRLRKGRRVSVSEAASEYGTSEKTIRRDISRLNEYLHEQNPGTDEWIIYDAREKGHILQSKCSGWMEKEEILAVAKILLESRAFEKAEAEQLVEKLLALSEPDSARVIQDMVLNELHHYQELYSANPVLDRLWELSICIRAQRLIRISYERQDKKQVEWTVKPVAVIFSEYYFYLIAYLEQTEKDAPTVFRMDRIQKVEKTEERFYIPYRERFEEGEFRKRIQFMYPGEMIRLKFRFNGSSLDAVLDRLPTAEVTGYEGETAIVRAEVYGTGIKMWLLSQAEYLEVLEPQSLREEMRRTAAELCKKYQM